MAEVESGPVTKTALSSKTIHFNWLSVLLVHAVWPFLPEHFRSDPNAISAVTAWFAIGNMIMRFFTTKKISLSANLKGPTDGTEAKKV